MTVQECACRDERTRRRIEVAMRGDIGLAPHASELIITMDDSCVIVDGTVPSQHLVGRIVPMVRRAGVLSRIENRVAVMSTAMSV